MGKVQGDGAVTAARRVAVLAVLAGLLFGCYHPPPGPLSPPVAAPAHPPPPKLGAPNAVKATWSFAITAGGCEARAANPALTLAVTIRPDRTVRMTLTAAHGTLIAGGRQKLGFKGPVGSWILTVRNASKRAVSVTARLDQGSANDVLALLGGGQMQLSPAPRGLPELDIPAAAVAGLDWFGCVRDRLPQKDRP